MPNRPTAPTGWLEAVRLYVRHPNLMLPFLLQGLLGGGFSWVFMTWDGADDPVSTALIVGVVLALVLANMALQGWAILLCGRALELNALRHGEAFSLAGRRLLRLLAVALLTAMPAVALFALFEAATTGWIQGAGVLLSFTLTSWLMLFGFVGVLIADRRAWPATREAFLLLGAAPGPVSALFLLLLAHSAVDRLLSGSLVPVGVTTLESGPLGAEATVAWMVFNVLWLPLVYLWLIMFYRNQQLSEPEVLA